MSSLKEFYFVIQEERALYDVVLVSGSLHRQTSVLGQLPLGQLPLGQLPWG